MSTTEPNELAPLFELIKRGDLHGIEQWIADGKPLEFKEQPPKSARKKTPLQYAVDVGFYTIVETLLKAKAPVNACPRFCPMKIALANRRLDLIWLLCEYGYDAKQVNMHEVFATWDSQIMEHFIERGADPETGMPLAWALINRVRTALGIFKKYKEQFVSFPEQANIALRHHCKDGNKKWVSLMLWAGADPCVPGAVSPSDKVYPNDPGTTAIGYAAIYGHYDVIALKQIHLPTEGPAWEEVLDYGCHGAGFALLEQMLKKGANPNTHADGGCPAIQSLLEKFRHLGTFSFLLHRHIPRDSACGYDNEEGRDCLKAIHLLVKYGAKWRPADNRVIGQARRALLNVIPDYTVEFVWLMAKYSAANLENVETLLGTAKIRDHVAKLNPRIQQIIEDWRMRMESSGVTEA